MLTKIISFIFILSFITYAQSDSIQIETEKVIEELINEPYEESDNSDLYEAIEYYIENPVNLNTASPEDLSIIPYFDLSIARKIIEYRNKYGSFFSVYELYSISDIPENIIKKSMIFLTANNPSQNKIAAEKNIYPSFSLAIRNRLLSDLQPTRGFKENIFKGSRGKIYNRFKVNYGENISAGLLIEKDDGEGSYTDFASGYINISDWMNISNLIIGDYIPEFGQGLALWKSYASSKGSNAFYPVKKISKNIKPYSGSTENKFFRGAAIENTWEYIKLSGFFSMNSIDASIDSTSGNITSISVDGLHRTPNELAKRKSTVETIYGIAIKSDLSEPFSLGFLYYNSRFNHRFYSPKLFELYGDNFNYYSSYFDLFFKNFNMFGEIAYDGKSAASFAGINYSISSKFAYILSIRNYPHNYINLHGYGFGEKSGNQNNEFGIYNGIRWSTVIGDINFYYDQFKFPYADYNHPLPSNGNEIMVSLNKNLLKKYELTFKYEIETKEIVYDLNKQDELVKRSKQLFRSEISYNPFTMLQLKTRLEYLNIFLHRPNIIEEGYLIYQDIRIKPLNNLMICCRAVFFSTDSFNSALYEYENDLTGVLNSVGLYGQGLRMYIMLKYRFIDQASVSFKYSETYKPKETTMRSGYSEIDGNIDNRMGFQLDVNL